MRHRFVACCLCAIAITRWAAPETPSNSLEQAFRHLDRNTAWEEVAAVKLDFDTHHPQGMTRMADRYYLSSVEVKKRAKGEGIGHLFEFNGAGHLLRELSLSDGPRYHPSGIDFDGESIWMALAEYRPDSTSTIYRVDPETMSAQEAFRVGDHIGGILYVPDAEVFIGVSWGSRRIYRWNADTTGAFPKPIDAAHPDIQPNPSHYIDYQDVQHVPDTPYIFCSGLAGYKGFTLGGIDLVDARDLRVLHQLPITSQSPTGRIATQNPFLVELKEDAITLTVIPDDNDSTMLTYTPRAQGR